MRRETLRQAAPPVRPAPHRPCSDLPGKWGEAFHKILSEELMPKYKIGQALMALAAMAVLFSYAAAFAADTPTAWEKKYEDEPYIGLLSEKTVRVNKDFSTVTNIHVVKKIQKEGAKSLGEIPIYYDKSCEEVVDIEAYTITPDGKKLRYEKIQDLSNSGDSSVYGDERVKMITMPGVVVGSIIDLKATTKRNKPIIENNFSDDFYFSSGYPIKEARYAVTAPKDMHLNFDMLNEPVGSKKPETDIRGNEITYTWTTQDNDKVEDEEYMPSYEEVYKCLSVTTLKDWRQLADWNWPLFKKNLQVSPEMKKKVEELTKGKNSDAEKIQAVIEYIRSDFRYVAMNMKFHNYEPHPADEVFKNKFGDCKDQTLLAIAMLSDIGVKAWPVLMSTYSELRREDLPPMPAYFNHVILAIETEGKLYYTDVLYKGYPFQDIPAAYDGKRVFVLNDKGGFFTVLPVSDEAETTNRLKEGVTIMDDGTAAVEAQVTLSRSISITLREALKSMSPDEKEKVFSGMEAGIASGCKILEKKWNNIDTPYTQVTGTIRYESTCLVQRMGDMMIFGIPQAGRGTAFTAHKRIYPIVFLAPSKRESCVTYTIPKGYEVMVLPKKVSLDTPYADYLREYDVQGAHVIGKESEESKRCRIPVEQYSGVQNFFDEIVKRTNERIMIKKKS
jgi:Domain of Unknown Function with PDB structure (DUF3857)/Transglutaminase-like superfamily